MGLALHEGTVLAGRFRLERLLGMGGMGVVWSATNTATGRRVAIKLLREDSVDDPHVRRRFLREGRAASAVQHPNVVEILDVLELEGARPAMVMELLEGESLGHRLRREAKLSLADAASLLVPAAAATGAAHAHGIVHRDLKPDNIFLAKGHGAGEVIVKVLDFGIAKMISEVEQNRATLVTSTGSMLGTPSYMAPEQLFSEGTLDYRCDLWSFGIILYECLAGRRPARGETFGDIVKVIATRAIVPIEKLVPDLPRDVAELIGRMLSFEAAERPKSLHEVCDVLGRYTETRPAPFGEPLPDTVRRTGGIDRALIPLLLADADSAAASAAEPALAPTVDVDAMTETVGVPREAETQNHLGHTVSVATSTPRASRKTWRSVVAVAAATAVLAVVARGALRSAETAPASASPPASPASSPIAETAVPPSPSAVVTASAAPVVSATATTTATTTTTARLPAVARPRSTVTPSDLGSAAPSVTATTAPPTSPGGLVEKPPF